LVNQVADAMTHGLPTISIVTISFNQARYLGECVESVLSQRSQGVEYIVVDPGSSDGSRDILNARATEIDHLVLEPDNGPADGLNSGFSCAGGDILGYVNADDRLVPGAIEYVRQYFARNPEIDVLCGAIRIIDEEGRPSLRGRVADRFDVRRYAARLCLVAQQGTFFRRSVFETVGGFNVANRVAWDGELLADMALVDARFARVRKVLGDFRVYRGTISSSGSTYLEKLDRYFDDIERKIIEHGLTPYSRSFRTLGRIINKANVLRYAEQLIVR
jgi:glycosyltransferase involved in cell wall biosynthesis